MFGKNTNMRVGINQFVKPVIENRDTNLILFSNYYNRMIKMKRLLNVFHITKSEIAFL